MLNSNSVNYKEVNDNYAGQRLDNYLLRELKNVPKSVIYKIIRKGEVRVNTGRVDASYKLQVGDVIRIPPVSFSVQENNITVKPELKHLLIKSTLYEDESLLIINKPAGLAVHGGSGVTCGLIEILRVIYPKEKNLELVHRLDRDTSGCIIIAKKHSVLRQLHQLLRDGEVRKTYHALVTGAWPKSLHKIDKPLLKNQLKSGAIVVKVTDDGKQSVTTFNLLDHFKDASLIEARPKTGRTHQIRVHTQIVGHAIIGDNHYNTAASNKFYEQQYKIKSLCLHAQKLSFYLPEKGQIQVAADYEQSFIDAIESLKCKRV